MKPEHASAIRAFDYFAAVCFGTVAATAASFVVPDALPAPLAMLAGMIVGTICAFPVLGILSYLLAGLELVMMAMQIGMISGMVGVMVSGGTAESAIAGASAGITIQLLLHIADRRMHGEVTLHE